MNGVKAISLWQPWASVVRPEPWGKHIESRSWSTDHRGPIAIHAGRRRSKQHVASSFGAKVWREALDHVGKPLPRGAIVAVAWLADCVPGEQLALMLREHVFGDYSTGMYAWILEDINPMAEPVPWRGRRGLFEVSDARVVALAEAIVRLRAWVKLT